MNSATAAKIWVPYCGAAPLPADWLSRWNLDPLLLSGMIAAAAGWFYWIGRTEPDRRKWLAAALALLFVLFVSPFCALTSALFSARVVHHVLLTTAVAPLIVLSIPAQRLRIVGGIAFWTAAHALVFWFWHSPAAYAAALSSDAVYWLMQSTLAVSAFGFWWAVRRAAAPSAVAALLATMVQMGVLGALITFAGAAIYAPHFGTTLAWGHEPLADQQLAGLIMWAPAAAAYLAAALAIAGRWLAREAGPATG